MLTTLSVTVKVPVVKVPVVQETCVPAACAGVAINANSRAVTVRVPNVVFIIWVFLRVGGGVGFMTAIP